MRLCLRAGLAAVVTAWSLFADSAAVLPFANQSAASVPNSANLDWIGESVAETVREALGSRGVLTLEREDVAEAYRRLQLRPRAQLTEGSILKVGESLDAEQVVHGSFSFIPSNSATPSNSPAVNSPTTKGSLRIQAHVTDRRRLSQSPEFVESGSVEDLASLEAHLAWRVLKQVAPKLAPSEGQFNSLRVPTLLDARESYIRGLLATAPDQKEKFFNQALRLDARFAHPAFELGKIHLQRKEYREAAELLEKIGPEDMHSHEANFLLGLARFQSGDLMGAQTSFQMLADAVPLSEVYNNLGAVQNRRNLPQAVDSFRKALDGDPNDPDYHFNLGYALFKKGDFTAAADQFRATLDREPTDQFATLLLGRCLKKQGLTAGTASTADARLQTLERLKTAYEERAYRQLKSIVGPTAP